MMIPEARQYLGQQVSVTYRDRRGDTHTKAMRVTDVSYVPMYGSCLVGDIEDVWLDRITSISAIE